MSRFAKIAKRIGTVLFCVAIAWLLLTGTVFNFVQFVEPLIDAWRTPTSQPAQAPVSTQDYFVDNDNGGIKYISESDKRKLYVSCPDGVSSRLMSKWLKIDHEVTDPDECMPFNDAVKLVERELPRLKASIDKHNEAYSKEWSAYRHEILGITQQGPEVAAPKLLEMLCGDGGVKNPIVHHTKQWTLFRDASPLTVWLAIKRIKILDRYGYATEVVKVEGYRGDVEYLDDDWFTQATMEFGPIVIGGGYYPYYGEIGKAPAAYLIESAYEGMRALGSDYSLPTTIYDGPYCDR